MNPEGKKRVASFLLSLDKAVAEQVLASFSPEEQAALREAMAAQTKVEAPVATELFSAFAQTAEQVLSEPEPAEGYAARSEESAPSAPAEEPDSRLEKATKAASDRLAEILATERPQTIAFILSRMEVSQSASLVAALPQAAHGEIISRMAGITNPCRRLVPAMDTWIVNACEEPAQPVADAPTPAAGAAATAPKKRRKSTQHKAVAKLLSAVLSATRESMLQQISQRDEEMAKLLRSLMFLFQDIVGLEDRAVQQVLREVDNKTVALALKGAGEQVKAKLLQNVSKRAAEMVNDEMELLGNRPASEIEQAQRQIAEAAQKLAEAGAIQLPQDSEEEAA